MAAHPLRPLLRKLSKVARLTPEAEAALLDLQPIVKQFGADSPIVREGDRPTHIAAVIAGFVYRYKIADPDKRQIIAFHLAGDLPDLQGLHLDIMDHSIAPTVDTQIALIPHATVFRLMKEHPSLTNILWRESQIDAAIFREWVVNVGRRDGPCRAAHLLCEMFVKAKAAGLASNDECDFPVSQTQFADATGMSPVHANRVIQKLRRENLIALDRRRLKVLDWERLKKFGDFDPAYLHLDHSQDRHAA